MKVVIKKEAIEKFLKYHNMSKSHFSRNCSIAVKTYDKIMCGKEIKLYVALKVINYTRIEFNKIIKMS